MGDAVGDFLRARRGELSPDSVGLPGRDGPRRVAGLRREEVAQLASISVDYYTRLEQGRVPASASVLETLARALRLDEDQRTYLSRLAGTVPAPARRRASEKPRPAMLRLLEQLSITPALVLGRHLDVLAWNAAASALYTDFGAVPAGHRNYVRLLFDDPAVRALHTDWEGAAATGVAALRMEAARDPDDARLAALVGDLSVRHPDFRRWWASSRVVAGSGGTKNFRHPLVGDLTLDCDMWGDPAGGLQRLMVLTADRGPRHPDPRSPAPPRLLDQRTGRTPLTGEHRMPALVREETRRSAHHEWPARYPSEMADVPERADPTLWTRKVSPGPKERDHGQSDCHPGGPAMSVRHARSVGATPVPAAMRHAWIAVLVVGAVLFVAVERTLVATQNPNFVPSAILLGAAVVPVAFLTFVYGRRLPYDVGTGTVALAALVGGVIGTVVAGTLEYDAQHDLGVLPMIGVGLIEELSKLVVPAVLLLVVRRYRTGPDGLLIGVASGAGFAALETMGYAFTTLLTSKGSITDTVDVLMLRGVMSPAGHMAWTGIAAAALYAAAEAGWTGRAFGRFALVFVVAVGLHTAWDSVSSLVGTAVVAVVSLVALGWTVHRMVHARAARPHPVA
ncbi:hypothetical protein GCM10009836_18900 [Pseudonocardia ailaonensis]|uniref:HTH cro/C1-type domain-containing protein n=1 Tax=Pseudonocardia ailaonensis TaxID=367279 RepID=A0ABN2MV44_9PSEU